MIFNLFLWALIICFFQHPLVLWFPPGRKPCRGFMGANQHHPAELNHVQIFMESQNSRLEGTSRIIRSNLSWQKHCPDKMIQQNPLSGKILHFPGKIIPGADFSPCGNFPSDIQSEPPQEWFFFSHYLSFFHMIPHKRKISMSFAATLEALELGDEALQTQFSAFPPVATSQPFDCPSPACPHLFGTAGTRPGHTWNTPAVACQVLGRVE